ncbi:MAG: hypothetical protein OXG68_02335 [Chloroflexi bacterium]|nr:hypothetical protein [Chloroflexota bacterium]
MSDHWWTLVLETGKDEAPLAQRETLEELLDIIPLLDEQEETSDVFRFVQGHTDKPERVLSYNDVIRLLIHEQYPD